MIPLLKDRASDVAALCRRCDVACLEVCGSAVSGDFHSSSDIDFVVRFDPLSRKSAFGRYFDLKEGLEGITGRSVDLVVANTLRNPYFREEVERTKRPVYAVA